ncbi:hypothetical protein Leryth_004822 [Lithospermum erythrorhizon]|nr:hypothetical protein Leryth_004822 [Lithospermum erythrorhizon]
METSVAHLAMAALVGASLVAVSAYYMHRKTLNQLLEFAKSIETFDDKEDGEFEKRRRRKRGSAGGYRRGTASLPDVSAVTGYDEVDYIPAGLPRLHTLAEGRSGHVTPTKRAGYIIRPTSPKSPAVSGSAFESVEDSDEEDNLADVAKLDSTYLHTNGDANLPDHVNGNGEQIIIPAPNMIRSHSVSGDLHSVQPDPVAADILRKEPEHETFVRLKISPAETPSADEAEVYRSLQACLEMRQNYVFREAVPPWEKEFIADPSTPKPNPDPFDYTPEGKSNYFSYSHVTFAITAKEPLFPVADATRFFTDLHHILKVIAAGNIRTVCHHRLGLLEQTYDLEILLSQICNQKFNLHLMLNADREFLAQKSAPHRDFYNVRKVDTHVHHSACMNQKHLLRFIKSKLRKEPDEVVIFRDGTYLTLKEVFESLDLTG